MIVSPRFSLTRKQRTGFPSIGPHTTPEHPYPASDLLLQWRGACSRHGEQGPCKSPEASGAVSSFPTTVVAWRAFLGAAGTPDQIKSEPASQSMPTPPQKNTSTGAVGGVGKKSPGRVSKRKALCCVAASGGGHRGSIGTPTFLHPLVGRVDPPARAFLMGTQDPSPRRPLFMSP